MGLNPSGWCCRSACPSPIGVPTTVGTREAAELCEACSGESGIEWPEEGA